VLIELSNPSHPGALRDYLLRLGAVVALEDDGTVSAYLPDAELNEDRDLETCLSSWAAVNGVDAWVVGNGSGPA
jgi:hypothetical protein